MLQITKPTLLLNRKICEANIKRMKDRADKHHVQLIPHFKTHQSGKVGEWFRKAGVTAITVTSVKMAEYFAKYGWRDITIAFPANVLEVEALNSLAARVDLKIFVNSVETAIILKEKLRCEIQFYVEVDTGDGRSGVEAGNFSEISEILQKARNSNLKFYGFYTHAGHTYNATSPGEVEQITVKVLEKLRALKRQFRDDYPELKLSLGDTPSCSIVQDLKDVNSIHPGNFVYHDLVQNRIGANIIGEIAICLAVPVVAVHPERQEVVVHSGWVHQGKDSLADAAGNVHYGKVVHLTGKNWTALIPEARVTKLSQEHGVITLPKSEILKVKVGDVLGILPVHACATAVMMGEIWTTEGERLEMMPR